MQRLAVLASRCLSCDAAVAVHRTFVLRANRSVGVSSPGIHKGWYRATPTPPKHCAGLSNNKGPHTRMCLHHRAGANQSRRLRGRKKEKRKNPREAFDKRVQGGRSRARPARPREAGRSTAQSQTVRLRLHSTCASHGQSSEPRRQSRSRSQRHTAGRGVKFLSDSSLRSVLPAPPPHLCSTWLLRFLRPRALPPSKAPMSRDKRRYGLPETPDLAGPR